MFNTIRVVPFRTGSRAAGSKKSSRSSRTSAGSAAGVLVVGVFTDRALDADAAALDRELGGVIADAAKRPECTGEKGRLVEAFPSPDAAAQLGLARVILAGLGDKKTFDPGSLRSIAGVIGRRLALIKATAVRVELSGAMNLTGGRKTKPQRAGRCFGEGLGLIGWNQVAFKGSAGDVTPRTDLDVTSADDGFAEGLALGLSLARSANLTRDLSNTPPNIATTSYMAEWARRLAKETGMSCKVIEGDALEKEGLVGLINVGKASENKPCLVRLEYTPKGEGKKAKAKPAVLVGKTMTYDTGGLSLKISNGMVGMKRDKDGGCAVLGAMHAVATVIKPRRPVVALLSIAENSISDEAYRPDDVIKYRNGVTVEVTNTDAEGRLVLADALIWACERENPEYVIDLATLTGGVVTALGSTFAGLFCDDQRLIGKLERAMDASGERWWRLPMDQEYRDMMKSPVADILNSNPNRKAHAGQGAAFLSYFVKPSIPWAHLDIAGVHVADSDNGCIVKGPTGFGARLLADLLAQD